MADPRSLRSFVRCFSQTTIVAVLLFALFSSTVWEPALAATSSASSASGTVVTTAESSSSPSSAGAPETLVRTGTTMLTQAARTAGTIPAARTRRSAPAVRSAQSTTTGPLSVPGATVAAIALGSVAQYKVNQDQAWKDYEDVVIIATLNATVKLAANSGQSMATAQYSTLAVLMRAWLDASTPPNQAFLIKDPVARLRLTIDALVANVNSAPAGSFLPSAVEDLEATKFTQLETTIDTTRQTPFDLASYSRSAEADAFIADVVQEATELAHNDGQYAVAVDDVIADLVGLQTTNSYSDIQALYPNALPTLPAPNGDGSFTLDPNTLMNQYQSVVASAQDITDTALCSLPGDTCPGPAPMKTASPSSGDAKGPCSDNKPGPCWSDAQSAISGLGKLEGLWDPQLGTQIASVGGDAIKASSAIYTLIQAGSSLSTIGLLGPMGAVAAAGVSIFSTLFGNKTNPNPNAAVLSQIKKLSDQITRLQADMDNQFRYVDSLLNNVLATLNSDFTLIDYQLGVLNGDAHAIEIGLLDVQSQLSQLQQYTLAYAQALSKSTLKNQMNGCLDYQANFGGDIGYPHQYIDCETDFYSWVTSDASDAIWALQPTDYSDSGIYTFFQNSPNQEVCPAGCPTPFAVDVNYLAQFPFQNLHLQALSGQGLANPNEFTLGARAYLELAHQWPQYAAKVSSSRLDGLIQVGTALRQAIVKGNSINGNPATPNQPLFTALAGKYNSAINSSTGLSLQSALQGDVNTFVGGLLNGTPTQGFDLWGGMSQSSQYAYVPPATAVGASPAFGSAEARAIYNNIPLAISTGLVALIPNDVKVLDQLGIAHLQLWYTVNGTDAYGQEDGYCTGTEQGLDTCSFMPIPYFGASCAAGQGASRGVRIIGTMNSGIATAPIGNVVFDRSGWFCAMGTDTVFTGDKCSGNLQTGVYNCWQKTLQDWQGNVNGAQSSWLSNSVSPQGTVSTVNSWLSYWDQVGTAVLQADQQNLYTKIRDDFSAATQVQQAGQQLTGAKLLLEAYANFALPVSLQNNSVLRAQLYGSLSVFDAVMVQADFNAFALSGVVDITQNNVTSEINNANSRLGSLSTTFASILDGIQQSQTSESLAEVDDTLADLMSLKALKTASVLTPCHYQLSAQFAIVGQAGGTVATSTQVPNGCAWTASTQASWLSVVSGGSGNGNGTTTVSVAAASPSPRDGILIIGDQLFHILQLPTTSSVILTVLTAGSGTVASSDGYINCGSACAYGYNIGTTVPLTATSSQGWTFTGWSGCDFGQANTCTVTMNYPRGVSASFTQSQLTYVLSVATIGSGTITSSDAQINCGTYCSGNYSGGSSVTLTATPVPGSTFSGWTGCDSTSGNTCTVNMNSIRSVTATFTGGFSGLQFVPVTPCRIADTRNPSGTFGGPSLAGNTSRDFPIVQGSCGIPYSAAAYSLNFTVVPHGSLGYLTVWPTGLMQPAVSTLNSPDGRIKANAAIVPAGSGGALTAFVTDTTDLIIDINGYFVSDPTQLAFYPLAPCRVFDTRNAIGPLGGPSMVANQQRDFPIQNACGIPSTAQAYSLNFTVVPQGPFGFLSVWPSGQSQPLVSTLNAIGGQVTANAAVVPAGVGGDITSFVTDDTDLIADINGYFAPAGPGGLSLYPMAPCRVLDTRIYSGAFKGQANFEMVGAPCLVPANAQALALNATVVPQGFLGYLTLWPDGTGQPLVSTLNSLDGAITSNMAIVTTLNGWIDAFTTDKTDLILDISSYFAP